MWARLKTFKNSSKGGEDPKDVNVNDEYLSVFKTKSYADFQMKAQLLVDHSSDISDFLLETGQEAIARILEKSNFSTKSKHKGLLNNYFDISAEGSIICSNLLTSINIVRTNYKFVQRALNTVGDHHTPNNLKFVKNELRSYDRLSNPFSNPNQDDFKLFHDHYSSVLQQLKIKKKQIAKKIKMFNCAKHTAGACITAACGAAATAAIFVAAHSVFGLLLAPTILSYSLKKTLSFQFLSSRVLKKVRKQLDIAAKGAYILKRDFDTMSRLVVRLYDEIEHSKAVIQFCLERKDDKFSLQEVVKELRKSDVGFRKQLEDLEEHVYLCLVTINRARALVIAEMTVPSE